MIFSGRELVLESGRMAKQANGAVVVRYGDTMVLVTATSNFLSNPNQDFFPLQVEYMDKAYAAGKIPGGFYKREGKPSEKEILSARLVDRPIRPLFPDGFFCDTQVVVSVVSSDQKNPGDVLGVLGASAALSISDIPFSGPIAGVRVGRVDGQFVLNPTLQELEESEIDIVVAGSENSVVMVEGEAREISEELFISALEYAHEGIKELIKFQQEFISEFNVEKYRFEPKVPSEEFVRMVTDETLPHLEEWRQKGKISKKARNDSVNNFIVELTQKLNERYPEEVGFIRRIVDEILKEDMRRQIKENHVRLDGRGFTEIRPVACEVGVLPRAHGSSLFTRGETQSLCSVTLGTKFDEQIVDDIDRELATKRYMLHYNFPPFCVGEVKPFRGPARREIGHGHLAERALKFQIPSEDVFPYTIRIVSDILESNGSSSMATVCAGSLALMDAGVPVKKTVAGIAMGLIKEDDEFFILSDIIGAEDHFGDMDFKVAGTKDGITAIQMDLKIEGISLDVLRKALHQAKEGRLQIIDIMEQTINAPRKSISPFAPKITTMKIDVASIGEAIGPGGKNVKHIFAVTGATIEITDDGTAFISGPTQEAIEQAKKMLSELVIKPVEGQVYQGVVKRLEKYGAFVEFLPGKEGLLHISEIDYKRIPDIRSVLKIGDVIEVKLKRINGVGRYELSRKDLLTPPEGMDRRSERRLESNSHRNRDFHGRNQHRKRF